MKIIRLSFPTLLLLVCCLVLTTCASLMPSATQPTPTTEQTVTIPTAVIQGTPAPFRALPTNECLAAGKFPPDLPSLQYGINVFLFATDTERVLTLTDIGGFNWIRQQIHWRDIEGVRGRYIWAPLDHAVKTAREYDLRIMLSIVRSPSWATEGGHSGLPDNLTAFAGFVSKLAERYRGQVSAYEVWNEPNLSHENGGVPATPAEYLQTLQAAYPAIKAADPCALVLSAPMASTNNADPTLATDDLPFYEELYRLEDGAFLQIADAVAVHPGGGPNPPAAVWPADVPEQSHFYFRHIERVREIMHRHDDPRQVWITEVGWSIAAAHGAPQPVSEQEQADYLVDTLWFIRQRYPWIDGVLIWNLNFNVIAPSDDEKSTFGLLNPDWSIRPAFLALQHDVNGLRDVDQPPFITSGANVLYAWTFPGRGKMRTPPLRTTDGTLYVMSDPGTLYAISPAGILYWAYNAPGQVRSAPAYNPDNERFYLVDRGGLLIALHSDGGEEWRIRLRGPARGSAIYHDGMIYAVTRDGEVQALDAEGREVWWRDLHTESTPLALSSVAGSDGQPDEGALLVATIMGEVSLLRLDRSIVWRAQVDGEVRAAPLPDGSGGAYVMTTTGLVVALDSSGEVRWQSNLNTPVVAVPHLSKDGTIYIAAYDGTLHALAADDGKIMWQFESGSTLQAPPARSTDGMLYLGTDDERLLALDAEGRLQWQAFVRGMVHAPVAVAPDGTIYLATMSGRLYALTPD